MEIRRLLGMARIWLPIALVAAVLAGAAAYVYGNTLDRTYQASTALLMSLGVRPERDDLIISLQLAGEYVELATSGPELAAVIAELGLDESPDQFRKRLDLSVDSTSPRITIDAIDDDPERAARVADAVATRMLANAAARADDVSLQVVDTYLASIRAEVERSQARVDELDALPALTPLETVQLTNLRARVSALQSDYAALLPFSRISAPGSLMVLDRASVPDSSTGPRPIFFALLGAVAALILILGVGLVRGYLNDDITGPRQLEELTGAPILGTAVERTGDVKRGDPHRLVILLHPGSPEADAYHRIRAFAEVVTADRPWASLLVTSGTASVGDSPSVAANLAVAFAQTGRRTLLVDANLRQPMLHRMFGAANDHGLSGLLGIEARAIPSLTLMTGLPNLALLPAGPRLLEPSEIIGSRRFREAIAQFGTLYDLVIVDSPPVLVAHEAAELSSITDATIVVLPYAGSDRTTVRGAVGDLAAAHANVIGVVLLRRRRGSHHPTQRSQDALSRLSPVQRRTVERPDAP